MVWFVWDVECRADEAADVGCWVEGWDMCVCVRTASWDKIGLCDLVARN
jgi:hypothetical protein